MPFIESHMNPFVVNDLREADSERNSTKSGPRGLSIPERVAQLYYKHGLLCSSYPWRTIAAAILIVLVSCQPLLSMPFPGNEPEEITVLPADSSHLDRNSQPESKYRNPSRWRTQDPAFYIQQIVIRSSVHPWTRDLGLMDAFRGPLGEIFKVYNEVVSFHSVQSNLTLRDVCLYVEGVATSANSFQHLLPEFSCLILSPANFWKLDQNHFRDDANFLDTIFSYKNPVELRSSMTDILMGVSLKDSGLKKYPVKTRSRVLTYAVTLILKSYREDVISDLRSKMYDKFPLHSSVDDWRRRAVVHIYYPERFNYLELIPLTFVYFILFLYIYYSVRKIEMVKSKVGMAFSAVVTVIASLGMSVGLCTWFGLRFTLQGRDIFPYLVIIIGLENILVLTRSVVSTPVNLDVKIRVAQGLSREGWNITKNLLTEVTILTVGFFTFVPAIQEFCMFAVVALLSDFMLQMLFFTTVLSIDILRMELSEIQRQHRQIQPVGHQYNSTVLLSNDRGAFTSHPDHPNLRPRAGLNHLSSKITPASVVTPSYSTNAGRMRMKVPRRIRIVHLWARTRFFQRTFMVAFVIWMGIFFYKYVIVQQFTSGGSNFNTSSTTAAVQTEPKNGCSGSSHGCHSDGDAENGTEYQNGTHQDELMRLQHPNVDLWRRLSYRHWPDLFAVYNMSLAGSYIAMLPPIQLSIAVPIERLPEVRNSKDEEYLSRSQWKSLASALDSLDVLDSEDSDFGSRSSGGPADFRKGGDGDPYIPSSPLEILLTTLLAIPSVAFLAYVTVVLYRCICSRHYAEWRSNWWGHSGALTQEYYSSIAVETMPLVLDGHRSPVECICTDGDVVFSVCLAGQLYLWDIQTGCAIAHVDRNAYFNSARQAEENEAECELGSVDQQVTSPVWCMQCFDGLVALGCANGRIEIWSHKALRCYYDDGSGVGVAKLKASGQYLLAARLNGCLESFQLEFNSNGSSTDSDGLIVPVSLVRLNWTRAHQQPISVLDCEAGRVVTGSQDHCIKVWKLEAGLTAWYSLHGHCGPITTLFIDSMYPNASGSGSQDGMLCLWDLSSGTCAYSVQAHDGSVTLLTYTSSYLISLGADDKLCVWERFQGHLLNTLVMSKLFSGSLAMLNDRLLLTSQQGSLVVWDVRSGEPIRQVRLGCADSSTFIRHIVVVRDNVICDYGTQLRIISFPMMSTRKVE